MSLLTAHEANLQRLNSVAAAALTACGSNTLAQATLTTTASQLQNVQLAIRLYTSGGSNNASYQFYAPTQAEMDQASADIAPTQGSLYTQLVSAPSCGGGSLEWPPVEEPIPTDPPVTI
jgi:hypothetical protein